MSKCTSCAGTGKIACPTCHGVGYFSKTDADGAAVQRLCHYCGGERQVRCGACRGTGEIAAVVGAGPAASAPARPAAPQPPRLAGRWKGHEGTWYEFTPDGNGYKVTAGGMRGVTGSGTATLVGHRITLEATDSLCGKYTLELMLHGNHMDGIDRKAGYPVPVEFHKV